MKGHGKRRQWAGAAARSLAVAGVLAVSAATIVSAGGTTAWATAPRPAGRSPSTIARMVCQRKAAGEIAQVLGTKAVVSPPTWTDHQYSCGYEYPEGTMVLSVKELSSWDQTYSYFDRLATTLHKTMPIAGLGQGAFRVRDGSIVVRKDWKVLLVNTSGIHGKVGSPPSTQSDPRLLER